MILGAWEPAEETLDLGVIDFGLWPKDCYKSCFCLRARVFFLEMRVDLPLEDTFHKQAFKPKDYYKLVSLQPLDTTTTIIF